MGQTPEPLAWRVRAADPDDAVLLAELDARLPDGLALPAWDEEMFARLITQRVDIQVVDGPDGLLGYVAVRHAAGESEILRIGVATEARRRGIGRALMARAIKSARRAGSHSMFLEVRRRNDPARTLYAGFGFTPVGERRNYYEDPPDDGVICRLDLSGAA